MDATPSSTPNESANPVEPKEKIMDAPTSNLPSSGTPNASAETSVLTKESVAAAEKSDEKAAEKGGEKPAKKTRKAKKKDDEKDDAAAKLRNNPATALKQAKRAMDKAEGNIAPLVVAALAAVQTNAALMPSAGTAADAAIDAAHAAKTPWEQSEAALKIAAAPVIGVLRATQAGRKLVATGNKLSSLTQAMTYVIAGLQGSGLSVPDVLMTPLTAALAASVAANKSYQDAEQDRIAASAKYAALKAQLAASVSVLSLQRMLDAANQRAKAKEVSTVPAPEPSAPPIATGGKESPPVAVVNGMHGQSVQLNGTAA